MRPILPVAGLALSLIASSLALGQAFAPIADTSAIPAAPVEARGVWVATVDNIDWPSAKGLPIDQQKAEIRRICELAAAMNQNFLVVQVRPSGDAIYPSPLEPWSEFVTGLSGRAPGATKVGEQPPASATYDPLKMWIDEAHERGLELHAWINPFRSRHFKATGPDAPNHLSKRRPDLVRRYDNQLWADPGEGEVQGHVLAVVRDLLSRYELDGLVIDDYFYPYPKEKLEFDDEKTYGRYRSTVPSGQQPLPRADWRRSNIDRFVERLYRESKLARADVRVGISPFGIWRPNNPPGISGMDPVEKLHADSRRWLREGWLDYVSPQLYWKIEAEKQAFEPLLRWWVSENTQSRQVWPSLIPSRIAGGRDASAKDTWSATDVTRQVELARTVRGSGGTILFSMKPLLENRGDFTELSRKGVFGSPSVMPPKWSKVVLDTLPAPTLSTTKQGESNLIVTWSIPAEAAPKVRRWVVAARHGSAWTFAMPRPDERSVTLPLSSATGELNLIGAWGVDALSQPGSRGAVARQ